MYRFRISAFFFTFFFAVISLAIAETTYDNDVKLGFYWDAANGNVKKYNVYVSVDNGPVNLVGSISDAPTPEKPYNIIGEASKTYRVQVEAEDDQGNVGPRSEWSDPVMCTLGDVNYDGEVDIIDLVLIVLDWLSKGSFTDINNDGVVNIDDLILVGNYLTRVYRNNPN